ncbi:Glutathione S transferase E4 [Carabus blaptoides fortunei]
MSVSLYHFPPSAPSRGALLVAKVLGVDIDVQYIDLFKKEQLKPDFVNFPILFLDEIEVSEDKKTSLDEALGFLDIFLDGQDFVAGDKLTVADCACVASVSSIVAVGWDVSPYRNVAAWITRCARAIPDYAQANQDGADRFGKAVRSKMAPGQI